MTTTMQARELTLELAEGIDSLARASDALGEASINVRGYTFNRDHGEQVARFVVDDTDRAIKVLEAEGFSVTERPALVTAVPHQPGELGRVARNVASSGADVVSSYVVLESTSGLPQLVFTFTEEEPDELEALTGETDRTSV